jgi:hypothetical protein
MKPAGEKGLTVTWKEPKAAGVRDVAPYPLPDRSAVSPDCRGKQQCLNFFPLPHGHGSFLDTLVSAIRWVLGPGRRTRVGWCCLLPALPSSASWQGNGRGYEQKDKTTRGPSGFSFGPVALDPSDYPVTFSAAPGCTPGTFLFSLAVPIQLSEP